MGGGRFANAARTVVRAAWSAAAAAATLFTSGSMARHFTEFSSGKRIFVYLRRRTHPVKQAKQ